MDCSALIIESVNYDGELANIIFTPDNEDISINLGDVVLPFLFEPCNLVPPRERFGFYTILTYNPRCTNFLRVPRTTPTPTPTPTPTHTQTPTPTPTMTPTPTFDPCLVPTPTPTVTVTATITPTPTPTPTETCTNPCGCPSPSQTPVPTNSPLPPPPPPTCTNPCGCTPTPTPTVTPTVTPTPTPTPTPTSSNLPISMGCVLPPMNVNGVNVTKTETGSVQLYSFQWASCVGANTVLIQPPSIYVGQAGSFTYTYNFSQPVNNLILKINASDGNESFTITTSSGIPTLNLLSSCGFALISNQIVIVPPIPPTGPGLGGSGCRVLINSASNFTSLTISGPGGAWGSLMCLEDSSVIPAPATPLSCGVYSRGINGYIETYNLSNNTLTQVTLPNDTFSNFPITHTVNKLWKSDQANKIIHEWSTTSNPSTMSFDRSISVTATLPGNGWLWPMGSITDTRLIMFTTNLVNSVNVVEMDITSNTVTNSEITQLFQVQALNLGESILYTSNNKIILTARKNLAPYTDLYFIQQYSYPNGVLEFDISTLPLGVPSVSRYYSLFEESNRIYIVRMDSTGTSIFLVGLIPPHTFTLVWSTTGTNYGVWSASRTCNTVNF